MKYQQTKVFPIYIPLTNGKSRHIGFVNVREQLEPADFKFVEDKLWSLINGQSKFAIGNFYVTAEVKRSEEDGGSLEEMVAEAIDDHLEQEAQQEVNDKLEAEEDTPF